jgi:hypothetical protein
MPVEHRWFRSSTEMGEAGEDHGRRNHGRNQKLRSEWSRGVVEWSRTLRPLPFFGVIIASKICFTVRFERSRRPLPIINGEEEEEV